MPSDTSLHEHFRKLAARRQAILIEIANARERASRPLDRLNAGHIDAFAQVLSLRHQLIDDRVFAKRYPRLLVAEIWLTGNTLRMSGSYVALAEVVAQTKMDALGGVPTFAPKWLPEPGTGLTFFGCPDGARVPGTGAIDSWRPIPKFHCGNFASFGSDDLF